MAFSAFRYRPEHVQGGLDSLKAAGVPMADLLQRIRAVMAGSRPKAGERSQHVVPFRGHYLVFVASDASPSTLVLAAAHKQPP
jgi:hypothetical protein